MDRFAHPLAMTIALYAIETAKFVFTNSKVPGFDGSLRSPARDDGLAAISD